MMILVQTSAAAISVLVSAVFLVPLQAPGIVYAVIAGATAWAATWAYARWKHGRGVIVRPSLRVDD